MEVYGSCLANALWQGPCGRGVYWGPQIGLSILRRLLELFQKPMVPSNDGGWGRGPSLSLSRLSTFELRWKSGKQESKDHIHVKRKRRAGFGTQHGSKIQLYCSVHCMYVRLYVVLTSLLSTTQQHAVCTTQYDSQYDSVLPSSSSPLVPPRPRPHPNPRPSPCLVFSCLPQSIQQGRGDGQRIIISGQGPKPLRRRVMNKERTLSSSDIATR